MNDTNVLSSWLVLGPIFNPAHQTATHSNGDGHPLAADIVLDIDRNPLDPRALTRSFDTAPRPGHSASYGNGAIFPALSYRWQPMSFAKVDWGSIHDIEDDIHRSLVGGSPTDEVHFPAGFSGKHHTLAFFLRYVHAPAARSATCAFAATIRSGCG